MAEKNFTPDLSVMFAGKIYSPNPFWLASAPPTNCGEQVMRAFDAGWGGAVADGLAPKAPDRSAPAVPAPTVPAELVPVDMARAGWAAVVAPSAPLGVATSALAAGKLGGGKFPLLGALIFGWTGAMFALFKQYCCDEPGYRSLATKEARHVEKILSRNRDCFVGGRHPSRPA